MRRKAIAYKNEMAVEETLPASQVREDGKELHLVTLARRISSYLELTKPRIMLLIIVAAFVGFYLGSSGVLDLVLLAHTLLGTALVGGGASALNQFVEREDDSKMRRTETRPLPEGRLKPEGALAFGIFTSVTGIAYLVLATNLLTGALAAASLLNYLFIYTPLKKRTSRCTLVGALSGAIPPVMGWTAVRGELASEAWVLFAIIFFWQFPHFAAIAWLYREDYARAGFAMLPVVDPGGGRTGRQITFFCLGLLPVSLLPSFMGLSGNLYQFGALSLGLVFLGIGLSVALIRTNALAKSLLLASLIYLPALFVLMMFDKIPA